MPEEDGLVLDDDDDDSFVVRKMDNLSDWDCRTVCCLRETDPPNAYMAHSIRCLAMASSDLVSLDCSG